MSENWNLTGALRVERFIGRTKELGAIREAVQAEGELRILHITGAGGVGKTRLLEQVQRIFEIEEKDRLRRYAGPFDFYHSAIQSTDGLEAALRGSLDPNRRGFQAYDAARQQLEKTRVAGGDPAEIERFQHSAEQCFVQGINEISARARVILTLDTVETIQYESDLVQEICQIELTEMEVKHWLLTNLPGLKNAVIILAGRENPKLLGDFHRCFGDRLAELRVEQFSEQETLNYFAAVADATPAFQLIGLSLDQQRVIHCYTAGFPLKLAFVIELLMRNLALPQDFFDTEEKARHRPTSELESIQQRVEAELVKGILTASDDIGRALPHLALARKGINGELLCRLTGWPEERAAQALDNLQRFSFVKVRSGSNWLFLHDELYDLLDRQIWNQMEQEREDFCRIILEYYQGRISQTENLQKQDLLVEQLYYQFLTSPREGYAEYTRLSDSALYDHDESFFMRLRDEMLRFCTRYPDRVKSHRLSRDFIDYDAAVRWVKFHRFTRRYDKAIQVAKDVKDRLKADQTGDVDFQLARADLDVNQAIALIYTGQTEPGIAMLKAVIADLEEISKSERAADVDTADSFYAWRQNQVLGLAHNNLGYVYWLAFGRYRVALEEFHAALPYFLTANLEEEIANTSDNMGRVYAQLGDRTRAELLIRDGLALRRRLGRELRIGLSLNSQIILFSSIGDSYGAYRLSIQSLDTFERLGAQREIGLACTNLGRSLRQLGALRKAGMYGDEECNKFLSAAIDYLKKAIEIFSPYAIDEPIRLINAYNELGCVYREQAAQAYTMAPHTVPNQPEQLAEHYLNQAITLAQEREYWVQYVDSYEDLAQLYFQALRLDKANECLNSAENAVPDIYKIKEGLGLQDIPIKDCSEEFWRQMGKIEVLRGHLAFDREQPNTDKASRSVLDRAVQHYALAAAYFDGYSGQARLQIAFEQLYDHFKRYNRDDLEYAQNILLPAIAAKYHLNLAHLTEFFRDTLGLALQITK